MVRNLAIVLTGVLALGCASHPPETPRASQSPARCNGQRQVVVTNHSGEAVEAFLAAGASGRFVGTVSAGRSESYPMGADAQYAYVQQVRGASPTTLKRELIDIRYSCE